MDSRERRTAADLTKSGPREDSRPPIALYVYRALLLVSVAAIILLSVVPPKWRPVTRVPHDVEHFIIFAMAGAVCALSFPNRLLSLAVVAMASAGAIEVIQLWVPGRHARVSDFVVDVLGAWFGLGVCVLFQTLRAGGDRSGAPGPR